MSCGSGSPPYGSLHGESGAGSKGTRSIVLVSSGPPSELPGACFPTSTSVGGVNAGHDSRRRRRRRRLVAHLADERDRESGGAPKISPLGYSIERMSEEEVQAVVPKLTPKQVMPGMTDGHMALECSSV